MGIQVAKFLYVVVSKCINELVVLNGLTAQECQNEHLSY